MIKRLDYFLILLVLSLSHRIILSQEQGNAIQGPWQSPATSPSRTFAPRGEKWDTLSLDGSNLRPDWPILGQVDTFPDFMREIVRVQWRDGDPIDLYIIRPVGASMPPVVIYLYGYPREAVRFLDMDFCKTVTKNGYAAIGFSSMLTGQRYHDVPMKEWFVSDLQHALIGTTHDVEMVLNYLATRSDFDMSRIGVFGEGSGGTIALLAADADARIKAVDVLNPWGDWPSWLAGSHIIPAAERASYANAGFEKSVASLDPIEILPRLTSIPVRVQQSLWINDAVPSEARDRIASSLPPGGVLAQYSDSMDYARKVGTNGRMLQWIQDCLRSGHQRTTNRPAHEP